MTKTEKSNLMLPGFAYSSMEDLIMICGSSRSGTSITGQMVGTFKNVEYAYEPPMIQYLEASLMEDEMTPPQVMDILRTYLCFDYLVERVQARGYSFRPGDESCVFTMKTYRDVNLRLNSLPGARDAFDYIEKEGVRLVVKFPDVYELPLTMLPAFPRMKVLDTKRNLLRIVSSYVGKGWLTDEDLDSNTLSLWPLRRAGKKISVPYLVAEADVDFWCGANAITRTVYISNVTAEKQLLFRKRVKEDFPGSLLELAYEELLERPYDAAKQCAEFLKCEWGELTENCVKKIKSRPLPAEVDEALKTCDPAQLEKLHENNRRLGYT